MKMEMEMSSGKRHERLQRNCIRKAENNMEKAKLQERYQLFIGGQWKDASALKHLKQSARRRKRISECAHAIKEM